MSEICARLYIAASLDRGRREFDMEQRRCLADVRQLRHRLARNTTTTVTTTTTTTPSTCLAAVMS